MNDQQIEQEIQTKGLTAPRVTPADIEAIWRHSPSGELDDLPWILKTDIPHEAFVIMEDGEPFSRGIVFSLSSLPPATRKKEHQAHE